MTHSSLPMPCSPRHRRRSARPAAVGLALLAVLGVPACGAAGDPASTASLSSSRSSLRSSVTLESGWAKAGSGMTAVFGTVVNGTEREVTIIGGSSASADEVQVHTMAKQPDGSMKMVQKKDGLSVPAGGSVELAPGGDHIMLVGLAAPLVNGDDVSLLMTTSAGAELAWTVPVRSFAGAEETYVPEGH